MKRHLKHGEFLGRVNQTLHTSSVSVSDLSDFTDRTIPQHTHQEAHLCYIVRGTYVTNAHNRPEPCSPQTLLYHPPGTTHHDRYLSQGGRFLMVSLTSDHYVLLTEEVALRPRSTGFTDVETAWFGARLLAAMRHTDSMRALAVESLVLEACSHIGSPRASLESNRPSWLRQAQAFIHACSHTAFTIRMLAEVVGVHPVHLARGFRRFLGCTPSAYVRRQRIVKASRALVDTDIPLAHVALDCGFADQSELTKNFKRLTHLTPSAYRRLFTA